jgi:uncharacterized protein YfbU (UPF0304 family)
MTFLTKQERLILSNQFRILAKLDADETDGYNNMVRILERGYTREYSSITSRFSEELSLEACEEVVDILDMHRALSYAYIALPDKSGINADDVEFDGFDGNNEGEYLDYASFLINRLGYWQESRNAGDGLNSHHSTLDRYRTMLRRWKASADHHNLTREDILRIIAQ